MLPNGLRMPTFARTAAYGAHRMICLSAFNRVTTLAFAIRANVPFGACGMRVLYAVVNFIHSVQRRFFDEATTADLGT